MELNGETKPGKIGQSLVLNLSMVSTHPHGNTPVERFGSLSTIPIGLTPALVAASNLLLLPISRLNLTSLKISIKIPSPVNNP